MMDNEPYYVWINDPDSGVYREIPETKYKIVGGELICEDDIEAFDEAMNIFEEDEE